jgi:glycerol-3-phosphate O-acyltransferase / dihydroxyacetone phosphate acyltransferase
VTPAHRSHPRRGPASAILYAVLRFITGIALRWFYRDVRVRHAEHVPRGEIPLLIVVNHPNALVDALVTGWTMPRPITITAKATLFENPVLSWLLQLAGVIPLRRASDERHQLTGTDTGRHTMTEQAMQARNVEAFRAILDHLEDGGAVLIFPEGKSHDEPSLTPLRTGPARIALQAVSEGRVRSLAILPIGLVFEQKETPRSRVLVDVGKPIDLGQWVAAAGDKASVSALTDEINRRLRDVTINYPTPDDAVRTRSLARILGALRGDLLPVGADRSLADEIELERRLTQAQRVLEDEDTDSTLRARADCLLDRLGTFQQTLKNEGIALDDVAIPIDQRRGIGFTLREGALLLVVGPLALWGRINHWLPFRLARVLGERDMTSRDQPAMRTILAGLVLIVVFYSAQTAVVTQLAGGIAAAVYLASLPVAADVDLKFTERMRRARQRMRAYLHFRRNPNVRERLRAEHRWLTTEVSDLANALEPTGRGNS